MTVAIAAAAIALFAYPLARHTPAGPTADQLTQVADNDTCPQSRREHAPHGVSEISWFQGTLEEAFAHHSRNHSHHRPAALLDF